ncbi:MAG: hypothetical protein ACRDKT_15745 [Actinomycetota bacterium]
MQRDPRHYREAARLLWDLPPERLSELASGGSDTTQSVRDAAHMALGVKREFLDPAEFGSEEAALDRLAANLAMLPAFSLQEIGSASGRRPVSDAPPAPSFALEPKGRTRRRVLRLFVTVLVLLLALEALAQAGIPVPSPIGTVVDGIGGEPRSIDKLNGRDARTIPHDFTIARVNDEGFLPLPAADIAKQRTAERVRKPKNENHAGGRRLHFAQGRDANKDRKPDAASPRQASRPTGRDRRAGSIARPRHERNPGRERTASGRTRSRP